MVLAAGDLSDTAYRKTRARPPPASLSMLLSRREHVAMRDADHGRSHRTWVNVRGKEREISVDLVSRFRGKDSVTTEKDRADVGMSVSLDGERVLHVRRLRWKFRGSERVDLGGGDWVLVSWDLHKWLFPPREPPPADAAAPTHAHAVFVFRFELGCGGKVPQAEEGVDFLPLHKNASRTGMSIWRAYFQRWGQRDWSETGSKGERKKKGGGGKLAMVSSSSSASVASSTASWASSSTVMEWAIPEEAEMQRGDGFSLLIYAWKS
uniref:Uncharacterized protein n=1 Tax=Avena sativa TaxID=4498 RepID=A0ACD5Y0X0_AVESA